MNWDSFKWRNYMPDIGRFFNVDPLAEDYYHNSTYAFSENRVIDSVELEGLEAVKVIDLKNNNVNVTVKVKPINNTNAYPISQTEMNTAMGNIISQSEKSYSGKDGNGMNVNVSIVIDQEATLTIEFVDVPSDPSITDTSDAIQVAQAEGTILEADFGNTQTGNVQISSLANFSKVGKDHGYSGAPGHTGSHELGHILGIEHKNKDGNLMKDGSKTNEREITKEQRTEMLKNIPEEQ